MIEATIADRENIRIGNEALADMKSLGATLVDPVDFSGAIAEIMTAYEPSFFTQTFPLAIPSGVKPIDHLAAIASDPKLLPGGARGVNMRMLAAFNPRIEARYALDLYFKERGDKKFRGVEDLYKTKSFAGENDWLRFALGVNAETLGTPDAITHTLRITNLAAHSLQGDGGQRARCLRLRLHHHSGAARLSEPGCRRVRRARRAARAQGGNQDVQSRSRPGGAQSQSRSRHFSQRRRQLRGESEPGGRLAGDRGAGG